MVTPSRATVYPATAVSSVEAVQARSISVGAGVAVTPSAGRIARLRLNRRHDSHPQSQLHERRDAPVRRQIAVGGQARLQRQRWGSGGTRWTATSVGNRGPPGP